MFIKPGNIFKRIAAVFFDHLIISILLIILHSKVFHLDLYPIHIDQNLFIVYSLITLLYFAILEYIFHKTIGKKIFGLEVTLSNGRQIDFKSALIRNLIRPIDMIGFYFLGMITIAFSPRSQRLGDILAKTTVIESI